MMPKTACDAKSGPNVAHRIRLVATVPPAFGCAPFPAGVDKDHQAQVSLGASTADAYMSRHAWGTSPTEYLEQFRHLLDGEHWAAFSNGFHGRIRQKLYAPSRDSLTGTRAAALVQEAARLIENGDIEMHGPSARDWNAEVLECSESLNGRCW